MSEDAGDVRGSSQRGLMPWVGAWGEGGQLGAWRGQTGSYQPQGLSPDSGAGFMLIRHLHHLI